MSDDFESHLYDRGHACFAEAKALWLQAGLNQDIDYDILHMPSLCEYMTRAVKHAVPEESAALDMTPWRREALAKRVAMQRQAEASWEEGCRLVRIAAAGIE